MVRTRDPKKHSVLIRMSPEDFGKLQYLLAHLRSPMPGVELTQSDVMRFALHELAAKHLGAKAGK